MKVTDSTISDAEATLIHVSVHSVSELRILSEKVPVGKKKSKAGITGWFSAFQLVRNEISKQSKDQTSESLLELEGRNL